MACTLRSYKIPIGSYNIIHLNFEHTLFFKFNYLMLNVKFTPNLHFT